MACWPSACTYFGAVGWFAEKLWLPSEAQLGVRVATGLKMALIGSLLNEGDAPPMGAIGRGKTKQRRSQSLSANSSIQARSPEATKYRNGASAK